MIVKEFNPQTNKWEVISITTINIYGTITVQYF